MKLVKILFVILLFWFIGSILYGSLSPDVKRLKKAGPAKTSFMEYREEEWRRKRKKLKIQKQWVPLSRISPYVIKAVVIAEDDKFWSHKGFDMDAIQQALEKDIETGRFKFGGSTISQQLAKNLYLTPSKSPARKIKEAILTWRIEQALSKRRILELYLNVVEWGEGTFGIEAASLRYYGKPALSLSADEASRLAAVLPNPRRYKVSGTSRYVERRAQLIYRIMARRGIVVPEYDDVMKSPDENGG